MAKVVDHQERKREILQKSTCLIAERGYAIVTYQQIAERCGLSRTALYRYFKTKRELFDAAITYVMGEMSNAIINTMKEKNLAKAEERLELVLCRSVELCLTNPSLLRAIFEYLTAQQRQGVNTEQKIKRHTVIFRRTIRKLLYEGIANGEFRAFNVFETEDMIFSLLQAVAVRIMFYTQPDGDTLMRHCRSIITFLKGEPTA